ncbi:MAG: NUDIX hydrolase [Pseudomonadota bacterium]
MSASKTSDKTAIRDAASVIVLRDRMTEPRVLMGQRGVNAAFMPMKFVFPGGAVDPGDAKVPANTSISAGCASRLSDESAAAPDSLCMAAIRELWEETGQILGLRQPWAGTPPADWVQFAERGFVPDPSPLQFVFRAITPPGRPRRFDARFFLVDADALASDPDDFSAASEELSHLHWVPLEETRKIDLPFITEVILAEIAARAHNMSPPETVPFFRNDDEESLFLRLHGDKASTQGYQ